MFLCQAKGPAHASFEHCGNIFGFLCLGPEIPHHQGLDKISDNRAFILQVIVQTDDDSGFSSAVALHPGPALAQASNRVQIIPIPHTNERYLRLTYTQGGTSPTATVSAYITDSPQAWVAPADGI